MPIYEFTCPRCEKTFEHLERTMQPTNTPACPTCGSKNTRRALSVFAVASDTAKSGSVDTSPTCGRCGGAPGSCGM